MSASLQTRDELAEHIAHFAVNVPAQLAGPVQHDTQRVLLDAIAVSLGALRHPAAQAARRHAYRFAGTDGPCALWGTTRRAQPELAALTNGVLLRCFDYNDFFVGQRNSGHPSDMMAGVIAAAEWVGASGPQLLGAIAVGYEVVAAAFDALSTAPGGWDYTNLVAPGATCAIARLLGLTAAQTREALAMTVVPHLAADEIESGELNARGDLTMWKRFNGSDAVRNALQACLLASAGVEGAVRPFTGTNGFIQKLANSPETIGAFMDGLKADRPLSRVSQTFMKRWPVGSLAQSAIQAALEARTHAEAAGGLAAIREVRVYAEEGAYEHLVKIREAPWAPISRETADHSLPYVVAAAVLDGWVRTESFSPAVVRQPERLRFLAERVKAFPEPALGTLAGGKHKRAAAGYLSRVEISLADGRVVHGAARPFPGHHNNPFSDADLETKLRENVEPLAGAAHAAALVVAVWGLPDAASVRPLAGLLGTAGGEIDGEPTE